MKQKYLRLDMVKVVETTRPSRQTYIAIINASYSQLYGGKEVDRYSVYVLDDNLNIINHCAWVHDFEITKIKECLTKMQMEEKIEKFNFRD